VVARLAHPLPVQLGVVQGDSQRVFVTLGREAGAPADRLTETKLRAALVAIRAMAFVTSLPCQVSGEGPPRVPLAAGDPIIHPWAAAALQPDRGPTVAFDIPRFAGAISAGSCMPVGGSSSYFHPPTRGRGGEILGPAEPRGAEDPSQVADDPPPPGEPPISLEPNHAK